MSTVSFGGDYLPKRDYTWADGTFGWENNFILSNWIEYVIAGLSINIDESLLFNEYTGSDFSAKYRESLFLNENNLLGISDYFFENLNLFDNYSSVFNCNDRFGSSFYFREFIFGSALVVLSDSFIPSEIIKNSLNSFLGESLSFNSNLLSKYVFPVSDSICYGESSLYGMVISSNERLSLREDYDGVSFFNSGFDENIAIYSSTMSNISIGLTENIMLDTEAFTGFDFVISNLAIFNKEMSFSDFDNMTTKPFGYSNFREFKVGEYTYEKALIRVGVSSSDINFSTAIDKLSLHVDIPDTDDRGVVNIPAAETFVKFNKKYYNPPEDVSLVIKGGTTNSFLVPKLISVTNLGFTVVIHDSSGNIASGAISWASKGY